MFYLTDFRFRRKPVISLIQVFTQDSKNGVMIISILRYGGFDTWVFYILRYTQLYNLLDASFAIA